MLMDTLEIREPEAKRIFKAFKGALVGAYMRREPIRVNWIGTLWQYWVGPHKRPVQGLWDSGNTVPVFTQGYWKPRFTPSVGLLRELNGNHDVESR